MLGQAGVELHLRSRVDHPEGFRSDDPHPAFPRQRHQFGDPLGSVLVEIAETAGDHLKGANAGRGTVGDDIADTLDGCGDDGQVDRSRGVGHGAVGGNAGDLIDDRVHGVERTREPAVLQVSHDQLAHRVLTTAHTDDDDLGRVEQSLYRSRLEGMLTSLHHGGFGIGRRDVELEADHALFELLTHPKSGLSESADHTLVGRQHIRHELGDLPFPRRRCEMLQEHRPEAFALEIVTDRESDLGAVIVDLVVAADPDDLPRPGRDESHALVVVDTSEAINVGVAEFGVRGEESEVDGLWRQRGMELAHRFGILGTHRAQVARAPIPQEHISFPLGRIVQRLSHACHATASPP